MSGPSNATFAAAPVAAPAVIRPLVLRLRAPGSAWVGKRSEIAIGAALLGAMVALAMLAPLLTAFDPRALSVDARLEGPSAKHLFGTDELGRDLFSRVLYGGRISLGVGFSAALLSSLVGVTIGLACAANRRLDGLLMRIMDGIMSIPAILLAIALMAVTGASVQNVVIAVTLVEAPRMARLMRGAVLTLRDQTFVEAAIAAGSSVPRILLRHLLPGLIAPLTVQATFIWAAAMIIESALSFIGAGTPPTIPSWGNIMADGKALWQIKPYLIFIPALFLSVSLLAVNLLGEGLRKAFSLRKGELA